jgi:hypothetical protein
VKTIYGYDGGSMTTDLDSPTGVVPFGWESGPRVEDRAEPDTLFRFPASHDPAPGTRRLLGISLYASALGLAGVGVGVRGFVSVLSGTAPSWYVFVLALLGLASVTLVVGALLSIHRRALPYLLLLAAALPLAGAVLLAVSY